MNHGPSKPGHKPTPLPGRPNVVGDEKKPFDEKFARTKDLERKEGESDADYAKRQEQFKTSRAKAARSTLRSALGKKWGQRVYSNTSGDQRKSMVSKLDKLKSRESHLTKRIENADDTALNDSFKAALSKKLENVTAKRKETGAAVRDFRGERREALEKAYTDPAAARKAYPRPKTFTASQAGNSSGRGVQGPAGQSSGRMRVQRQPTRRVAPIFGGPKNGRPVVRRKKFGRS
jgi:hypothetical protein